jgi:hypothetical protein
MKKTLYQCVPHMWQFDTENNVTELITAQRNINLERYKYPASRPFRLENPLYEDWGNIFKKSQNCKFCLPCLPIKPKTCFGHFKILPLFPEFYGT